MNAAENKDQEDDGRLYNIIGTCLSSRHMAARRIFFFKNGAINVISVINGAINVISVINGAINVISVINGAINVISVINGVTWSY